MAEILFIPQHSNHNASTGQRRWWGGSYDIAQIKVTDGKCLDASQRNTRGGKVHMWDCNTGNLNQQWMYNAWTYQIKAKHGKCLDASQRNTRGGKVHMWDCNTANKNQQWLYDPQTGQIKAKHGKCLDASQRNTRGGKVHMWDCNTANKNQQWTMTDQPQSGVPSCSTDTSRCGSQWARDKVNKCALTRENGCTGSVPGYGELFKPACNLHDACWGQRGCNRVNCDKAFLGNMLGICDATYSVLWDTVANLRCKAAATTMKEAVASSLVSHIFDKAQDDSCSTWDNNCNGYRL